MVGYPSSEDQNKRIDQGLAELNRLRNQPGNSLVHPEHILRSLQRLLEEGRRQKNGPATLFEIDPDASLVKLSELRYLDKLCAQVIERHGIRTIQDFTHFTERQIREIGIIGEGRMTAIKMLLIAAGIQFRLVRESGEWRRLNGGPILLKQLLTLSLTTTYSTHGKSQYRQIAKKGIITFGDYREKGREGVRQAIGDDAYRRCIRYIDQVFDAIETPAY